MMDVDSSNLVTVSYADHSQHVAIALRNMFDSKRGTDFDFRFGGKSVRAHRLILELFLTPEITGSGPNELPVPDQVKKEVTDDDYGSGRNILDFVMEFLYKGEVAVPEQQLDDLLGIAKELDFKMLIDAVLACRPMDIITEDELDIDMKRDPYFSESVGDLEEFMEPRIENAQFGRDGFDTKKYFQSNVSRELALRPCFVNLGPRISASYQSAPTDTNVLGHPFLNKELEHFCEFYSEPDDGLEDSLPNSGSDGDDDGGTPGDDLFGQGMSGATHNKKSVIHKAFRHYKCSHCNFETPVYKRHIAHLENIHGITDSNEQALNRKCPNCEFQTSNRYKYRRHCLSAHQLTVRGDAALKRKCPKCDYSSSYASLLKRHLSTVHTQERNDACLQCSYVGKTKAHLKKHFNRVHRKKRYSFMCKVCKKRFEQLYKLNHHLLIHTTERPFKCPHCNYATKVKFSLKSHLNVMHGEGESRYTCKTCKKRCAYPASLERHSKIHLQGLTV